MKTSLLLFGLLVAFQLSAQDPGFGPGNDQQAGNQPAVQNQQQGNWSSGQVGAPGQGGQFRGHELSFNQPQGDRQQAPFFGGRRGQGDLQQLPFDQLSEKDRKVVEGYLKELRKTLAKTENELALKQAELRYLTNLDKPDINKISAKLDEVSKLETTITLERIKVNIKIKEQFPDLQGNIGGGPGARIPQLGAAGGRVRPNTPVSGNRAAGENGKPDAAK